MDDVKGSWGGGASPLSHCIKPWYMSPFIILVSDGVTIHTGKLGIIEVKALNTLSMAIFSTTVKSTPGPLRVLTSRDTIFPMVIEGTGTLNVLYYLVQG